LTLADASNPSIDGLRYGNKTTQAARSRRATSELAHLKLRYKLPNSQSSRLLSRVVHSNEIRGSVRATSDNYRFAAAASGFGQLLRGGKYTNELTYADLVLLANGARGTDSFGYRSEFVTLLRTAAALTPEPIAVRPGEIPGQPHWRDQQWSEELTMVQPAQPTGQPQG
jgi:Ca-activated chloride channel family protein